MRDIYLIAWGLPP